MPTSLVDLNSAWFWILLIWTLAWKGYALWIAARQGQKAWYVALLILNTLGILEILYIYIFSRYKRNPPVSPPPMTPPPAAPPVS